MNHMWERREQGRLPKVFDRRATQIEPFLYREASGLVRPALMQRLTALHVDGRTWGDFNGEIRVCRFSIGGRPTNASRRGHVQQCIHIQEEDGATDECKDSPTSPHAITQSCNEEHPLVDWPRKEIGRVGHCSMAAARHQTNVRRRDGRAMFCSCLFRYLDSCNFVASFGWYRNHHHYHLRPLGRLPHVSFCCDIRRASKWFILPHFLHFWPYAGHSRFWCCFPQAPQSLREACWCRAVCW